MKSETLAKFIAELALETVEERKRIYSHIGLWVSDMNASKIKALIVENIAKTVEKEIVAENTVAENTETEKRGRGRPKGKKSKNKSERKIRRRKKSFNKWSAEDDATIKEHAEKNYPVKKTAGVLKRTLGSVYDRRRVLGVTEKDGRGRKPKGKPTKWNAFLTKTEKPKPKPKPKPKLTAVQEKDIKLLIRAGVSVEDIAKAMELRREEVEQFAWK